MKKQREKMSMHDRAAQFAPYRALNGFDDATAAVTRQNENQIWQDVDFYDRQDSLEF